MVEHLGPQGEKSVTIGEGRNCITLSHSQLADALAELSPKDLGMVLEDAADLRGINAQAEIEKDFPDLVRAQHERDNRVAELEREIIELRNNIRHRF